MYFFQIFVLEQSFYFLHQPGLMQEEVMRRIRQVVHENMGTVQKVAYLLGENAARTETMLNALVNNPVKVSANEQG